MTEMDNYCFWSFKTSQLKILMSLLICDTISLFKLSKYWKLSPITIKNFSAQLISYYCTLFCKSLKGNQCFNQVLRRKSKIFR